MSVLESIFSPRQVSPGAVRTKPISFDKLTPAVHEEILNALDYSDLDSPESIVLRTDQALLMLESKAYSEQ